MKKKSLCPNILLVNPWIEDFAAFDFWAKPLGLLRIASWLKSHKIDFAFLDCLDMTHPVHSSSLPEKPKRTLWGSGKYYRYPLPTPEPLTNISRQWYGYGFPAEYIYRYLQSLDIPDVIFIHSSMTYWYIPVKKIADFLRQCFPSADIFIGGIYATLCYEHAKNLCHHYTVHSGPSFEFLRRYFLDKWALDLPIPNSLGLPYPYELYPGSNLAVLSLSSGCPFRCTYCASKYLHPGFQTASLSFLKDELKRLALASIHNITFYDDALLTNADKILIPLLDWSLREGLQFTFHLSNGVNMQKVTPEICRYFKDCRFETLRFGFETADRKQQKSFGGKVTNKDLLKTVNLFLEAGFPRKKIGIYLLAGFPNQKREDLKQSIDFVIKNGAKPYISEFSPIPHTRLWEESCRVSKYPLEKEPLFHNSSIFPCEWAGFTRKDLYELKNYCRNQLVTER